MERKIIVGGNAYADIDVVACALAYKQLLEILGNQASAVITPPLNATVPSIMHTWLQEIETTFVYKADECSFILVDVSDPHHLNDFVHLDTIQEVFDHHYGFQDYWAKKLKDKACIEFVGACATLIWEQFKKYNAELKITPINANLLYTAIIANTLHFKAHITHARDINAAQEILPLTSLDSAWITHYYSEVQKTILHDPLESLARDTKVITIFGKKVFFSQIELYDALPLLETIQKEWEKYRDTSLRIPNTHHILSIVSIKEGKNYIITSDTILSDLIRGITHGVLHDNFLITSRLWLRKEILKEIFSCS